MLIDAHERHKLEEKSIKCIFIGYCSQTKAYRVYNPSTGKVIISRNTRFNDEDSWKWEDSWQWEDKGKASAFQIEEGEEAHRRETRIMTTSISNSAVSPDVSNSMGRSIRTTSTHQGSSSNSFNSGACSADGDTDNDGDSETPPRKIRSLREIYESCTLALYVS